ncbi:MAG: ABC transporter substrate-binding protein [Methylococcaceae bacterium]
MVKNILILLVSFVVVALPFVFQQETSVTEWQPGDPELVVVTPHNEAIRFEFSQAFNGWHQNNYGQPAKIDWRAIGGTTEIMRYLEAAYVASYRGYWQRAGKRWPSEATQKVLDGYYQPDGSIMDELYQGFRQTNDATLFTANIDVFFGGGEYDHNRAYQRGLTVPPWPQDQAPKGLFTEAGITMIPPSLSGEIWRTPTLFGAAISTFGICYNMDRLRELKVAHPTRWDDLANPKLFRQVGISDPTKSGSIAKAFEMIIQQKIHQALQHKGFKKKVVKHYEALFTSANDKPWELPKGVPVDYQNAVEQGWLQGIQLVQRIGANARYFTDSATKVPIDVSMGNAAMGLAIDFYGRYQAENSRAPDGSERMRFITPEGGSSVSADPISLLRSAPHKETATRFIKFVLSEQGQQIWNYRPGEVGGPLKFALRRLPIRRSFYPSTNEMVNQKFVEHHPHLTDNLADPNVNPYQVGKKFTYYRRWTGHHFNIHRNLIKAMCLDAGEELKAAWEAINSHGDLQNNHKAIQVFSTMPDGLNWRSAIDKYSSANELEFMRLWVIHFRNSYLKSKELAEGGAS